MTRKRSQLKKKLITSRQVSIFSLRTSNHKTKKFPSSKQLRSRSQDLPLPLSLSSRALNDILRNTVLNRVGVRGENERKYAPDIDIVRPGVGEVKSMLGA